MSAFLGTLIFSKYRVYVLKDRDQVGQSASRSVEFYKWTVLIGRRGFGTISSIPDPTLSLRSEHAYLRCEFTCRHSEEKEEFRRQSSACCQV